MTLKVIDSTKKVGKGTNKIRNLYKDSNGKWFMDCGRCNAIRPYEDFHQLKIGWHKKHSCCKYCKSEIKRIDKQKKAKQLKEQLKEQPKAGIEKRNLSVNLDVGIWKAVKMQAIMEDVPADVLVEKMVLYYLAKTDNNVLKL